MPKSSETDSKNQTSLNKKKSPQIMPSVAI